MDGWNFKSSAHVRQQAFLPTEPPLHFEINGFMMQILSQNSYTEHPKFDEINLYCTFTFICNFESLNRMRLMAVKECGQKSRKRFLMKKKKCHF